MEKLTVEQVKEFIKNVEVLSVFTKWTATIYDDLLLEAVLLLADNESAIQMFVDFMNWTPIFTGTPVPAEPLLPEVLQGKLAELRVLRGRLSSPVETFPEDPQVEQQ